VVDASQIQTAHDATAGEAPAFVVGFLPLEDRMVTVLRLDEIVSSMQGGAAAIESFAA
jgi:chemotaxis signal transduction protein